MRQRGWTRLLALLFAIALLVAACGNDDDSSAAPAEASEAGSNLDGVVIEILSPETSVQAEGFVESFEEFTEETGIEINYSGSRDASTELSLAIEAGDPPDIAMIPQPGRIQQFAAEGSAVPLDDAVLARIQDQYDPFWFELATYEEQVYGVPVKADLKSLVWYSPAQFEANGYEVPETWDELEALTETMKADGQTPWCVGVGSGDATGWVFTDWMEDLMLRLHGPDVYDQWVNHEIPFDDQAVAETAQFVGDIWFEEGNVLGGRELIAATGFEEAGLPILDGSCMLHRQANFYASFLVDAGAEVGPGLDADAFYLPTISDDFGTTVLGAGLHAVAFTDNPGVQETLEFLGSEAHANQRILADRGGYLSANVDHDTSLYSADLDRNFAEILVAADPFRFDGSDLMPGEVGAGEFWRSGTDFISGSLSLEEFLENAEQAWPG